MTIRQLELYSGVANSYLSQLENGKRGIPSPTILEKVYKGHKVPKKASLINAGYADESHIDSERDKIIQRISTDFPDADLMFNDLAGMSAEELQEVYEFIKFKKSQKDN